MTQAAEQRHGNYSEQDDVPFPGGGDVENPYPGFAEARAACPVVHVGDGEALGRRRPTYLLLGREVASIALEDDARFSSSPAGEAMRPFMGRTILEMEGAEHLRHRKLVAMAFRPKQQLRWEDELVKPLMHELIDDFYDQGKAELVGQVLYRYPIQVIARILGMPREHADQFQRWAIAIITSSTDPERGKAASTALTEFLKPILAERRADPQDDLISDLVRAEIDGHVLSDEEILPFLLLLMPAGGETTYRATGNLLHTLLSRPDVLARVDADRSLVGDAIEEALRWEPPLLMVARSPKVDVELQGQVMPAGALVIPCVGAANHDPSVAADADEFDLDRGKTAHLTFGNGPHMCLGMHLARMEMKVALETLLDRLPNLRLDPDAAASAEPPHIRGMTFRSPTSLPVVWDV